VGSVNFNDVISYSISGPVVRSVGLKKDIRFYRSETYASYWFLSIYSFLGKRGDSYDRFLIRVREMYESVNIVFQVLSNLTSNQNNNISISNKNKKKVNFFSFFNFMYKVKKKSIF
jgi:NADH:ubiquinone oxidoreductase subunit D